MSDLIDTTEMYLKSIMEVLEEGAVPLRARIAERLGHSGPTVSQTVARMERDGLLTVEPDRRLVLSEQGHELGVRVLRKHRLVERLLTDVIGLDWERVHDEACRWEHVVSDEVEQRLVHLLEGQAVDPFGNPIPGMEELGGALTPFADDGSETLADAVARATVGDDDDAVAGQGGRVALNVRIARIGEVLQADDALLVEFARSGVRPGAEVELLIADGLVSVGGVVLHDDERRHLRVTPVAPEAPAEA